VWEIRDTPPAFVVECSGGVVLVLDTLEFRLDARKTFED
jgi:hypothetical protein